MNRWIRQCPALLVSALVLVGAAFFAGPCFAVALYWDTGGAAGIQGGNGNWNTSGFWNPAGDGSGTAQDWTSGADADFTATDAASTVGLEGNTYTVGSLVKTGTPNLTLQNGALNITGNVSVTSGTVNLGTVNLTGAGGAQTINFGNAATTLAGTLNIGPDAFHLNSEVTANTVSTFNMALNGMGNLIFDKPYANGSNRMSIGGNNGSNWTGDFLVAGNGTAQLTTSAFFTKNNLLDFRTNGLLSTRNDFTVGGLSGNTGTIRSEVNSKTMTIDTSVLGDASFGGSVAQYPNNTLKLNVVKTGVGAQIFSGTNTYLGATTVSKGTLLVNGAHTNGDSYTVVSGGTLGGMGTVSAAITVNSGGTLAAGGTNGLGALTVTNLTLAPGATNRVALAGAAAGQHSLLHLSSGNIDLTDAVLTLDDTGMSGAGEVVIVQVDAGATLTGTFAGLPEGGSISGSKAAWTISYAGGDGNDVSLTRPPLQIATRSADAVTDGSANLSAEVICAEGGADLWIYYGTNDGTTVAGSWQTHAVAGSAVTAGVYAVTVFGLQPDQRYYYRAYASNGSTNVWADSSQSFGTQFLSGMAPSNLTAQGGWDHVDMNWDEGFSTETGFVIERGTNAVFSGDVTSWLVAGSDVTNATDAAPLAGVTGYYRVAATNAGGLSAWSDVASATATSSVVTVTNVTLTAATALSTNLQEQTRQYIGLGTRHRDIDTWVVAGTIISTKNNPNPAITNSFINPQPEGMPTNSSWYLDYLGASSSKTAVKFRQPFAYPLSLSTGGTINLELVPVFWYEPGTNETWNFSNQLLLNTAYSGEVSLEGKTYIVDVVQGGTPEYLDRWGIPGRFDDPNVNVFVYEKGTTNFLSGYSRLKFLDGKWYEFENNETGESLTVSRIDRTGTMVLDFPQQTNDFSLYYGMFRGSNGRYIPASTLDLSTGRQVMPAGDYTFDRLIFHNNGYDYQFIWQDLALNGEKIGHFTVADKGDSFFRFGYGFDLYGGPQYIPGRFGSYADVPAEYECSSMCDAVAFNFYLFDADLKGAVVPKDEKPTFAELYNSTNRPIGWSWSTFSCGWDGQFFISTAAGKNMPSDLYPPKVLDDWHYIARVPLQGIYGDAVVTSRTFRVKNQVLGVHARFYDFDRDLDSMPDFDTLIPEVDTVLSSFPDAATASPWTGLPSGMADTFGMDSDGIFLSPINKYATGSSWDYNLIARVQGAVRVYIDGALKLDAVSHDQLRTFASPAPVSLGSYEQHTFRIEYLHKTGDSALKVYLEAYISPYGYVRIGLGYPAYNNVNLYDNMAFVYQQLPGAITLSPLSTHAYTAPASIPLSGTVSHPDGVAGVQIGWDSEVRFSTASNTVLNTVLTNVPVNASVLLRVEDPFGMGTVTNLPITIARETLQSWLDRYGLSNPDGDDDGDGISNRDEFAADTSPTNAASAFMITDVIPCGASNCVSWIGAISPLVMDRYELRATPDLLTPWSTVGVIGVTSGTDVNQFWDTAGSNNFYRVQVISR